MRAKADTSQLTATQLRLIGAQRRVWERRMVRCCWVAPAAAVVHLLATSQAKGSLAASST